MEERKQKEIDFHNKRENERVTLPAKEYRARYSNRRFYSITRKSQSYWINWVKNKCHGKRTLDYCCGLGDVSLVLAKQGADVYGIDISSESIKTARNRLAEAGYSDVEKFNVMDAEHLEFEDNFFDRIICTGVLHHLDLNRAYFELARVLKPDGEIICVEALGYNPLIRWYRKRTLHLRTEWEVDHILTLKDIQKAQPYFKIINVNFFHFFSILSIPFIGTLFFEPLLSLLDSLDLVVLKIPLVRLMAWQIIFVLKKPKVE